MFVIESAIAKAAQELKITAAEIQVKNLLKTGDAFPFGQLAESESRLTNSVELIELTNGAGGMTAPGMIGRGNRRGLFFVMLVRDSRWTPPPSRLEF